MKINLKFIYWIATVNIKPCEIKRILRIKEINPDTIEIQLNDFFQKFPDKLYYKYVGKGYDYSPANWGGGETLKNSYPITNPNMWMMHLSMKYETLENEIRKKRTTKTKNELAVSVMKNPKIWVEPYVQVLTICRQAREAGQIYFTSGECDNIKEDGSCGWHKSLSDKNKKKDEKKE